MSHRNYRVMQAFNRPNTSSLRSTTTARHPGVGGQRPGLPALDDHHDLKGTVEIIQKAFDKPLLRVVEGDRLVEVSST